MLAASGSVSSCVPCLADSEGHVLPLSSLPSDSYDLSASSSRAFPELSWKGSDGDLQWRLSLHIVSGCGSLHLFPSAPGRSLYPDSRLSTAAEFLLAPKIRECRDEGSVQALAQLQK